MGDFRRAYQSASLTAAKAPGVATEKEQMESPGEYLKREREMRGVTLNRIFETTRVPMKYLVALESDDLDSLPHPTFAKGFIKSYSRSIGIDETDAVLHYEMFIKEKAESKEEHGKLLRPRVWNKQAVLLPRETIRARKSRNRLVAAGVLVILAVIIYSAARHRGAPPAPPEKPKIDNAGVSGIVEKGAVEDPVKAIQPLPAPAPSQQPQVSASAAEHPMPVVVVPSVSAAASPAAAAQPPASGRMHVLSISARESTWVKIRIDDGEPFEVVLKKGERISWKAARVFSLVVGNAGGVNITLNGERLAPLGQKGEVVSLKLPKPQQPVKAAAEVTGADNIVKPQPDAKPTDGKGAAKQ